jgi:hypothetical protein
MKNLFVMVLICAFSLALSSNVFSQSWKYYRTKGTPGFPDVSIGVAFPSDFETFISKDNDVVTFLKTYDDSPVLLRALQLLSFQGDIPPNLKRLANKLIESGNYDLCYLTDQEIQEIVTGKTGKTSSGNPVDLNRANRKTFGGACGLLMSSSFSSVIDGMPLYSEQDMFFFGYMNKTVNLPRFVGLTCSTTGSLDDANYVTKAHASDSVGLCQSYFESLKIYDR